MGGRSQLVNGPLYNEGKKVTFKYLNLLKI